MDAFYEADERILGHAPTRIIALISAAVPVTLLLVRQDDRVVADTRAPLVLYEPGFAPRWYGPRAAAAEA